MVGYIRLFNRRVTRALSCRSEHPGNQHKRPSNKPLEWAGHHSLSATPPKLAACRSGAALGFKDFVNLIPPFSDLILRHVDVSNVTWHIKRDLNQTPTETDL